MSRYGILEAAFLAALATVAYVYVGYPVLLGIWARVAQRHAPATANRRPPTAGSFAYPPVSVVIAARNEARRLPGRIENLLTEDYPAPIQVVVVSDGSTDDTMTVLAGLGDRVEAVAVPAGGKALALNAGVARAAHPMLVFADARQRFAPDALRHLIAPFVDPAIGAVSGQLVLDVEQQEAGSRQLAASNRQPETALTPSTIADGVGAYWRYEKWLRRREAIVGSTLGVTGAIYAMRREAWRPLPADTLLDDVLGPMRAVLAGWRVIVEERALAFDRAPADAAAEWRRKVRTLAGNYQILAQEPRLLVPVVNPVWLQYVSHKIGRLLVPWALVVALLSSAVLAGQSVVYAGAFVAQAGFYALAAYGAMLEWTDRDRAGRAGRADGAGRPVTVPEERLHA